MARTLLTPIASSEMTTIAMVVNTTDTSYFNPLTTANFYVKTTGIDPTKLVFIVLRNSSKCSSAGLVTVISGSTGGNIDFEPGAYSTGRNLNITIPGTTRFMSSGGKAKLNVFYITESARFKDTDGYIKLNVQTKLTSATHASVGGQIGCIYLKDI